MSGQRTTRRFGVHRIKAPVQRAATSRTNLTAVIAWVGSLIVWWADSRGYDLNAIAASYGTTVPQVMSEASFAVMLVVIWFRERGRPVDQGGAASQRSA